MTLQPASMPVRPRSFRKRAFRLIAILFLVWLVLAYLFMPAFWKSYARRHPEFEKMPGVTFAGDGIPADPINVSLVGTKPEVVKTMLAAKWYWADALSFRSSLEIAAAAVLKRAYDDAPVSSEFLFGRKQDLAFEQAVGNNPRQRHHVRFWNSGKLDPDGRPIWIGSAVFDTRVGLSRTTGQITHETAPDVDKERDTLFADLKQTGALSAVEVVDGFHKVLQGRNGQGNAWFTDGDLYLGVLKR